MEPRPRETDSPKGRVRNIIQGLQDTGGERRCTELVVTNQPTEGLDEHLWAEETLFV